MDILLCDVTGEGTRVEIGGQRNYDYILVYAYMNFF